MEPFAPRRTNNDDTEPLVETICGDSKINDLIDQAAKLYCPFGLAFDLQGKRCVLPPKTPRPADF